MLCPALRCAALLAVGLWVAWSGTAQAADRFGVAGFLGVSKSFGSGVDLTQADQPSLHASGTYESRSLRFPLYYAIRFSWRHPTFDVELQLVHHKIHLVNPPVQVQHFEISHGFNLLTANYTLRSLPVDVRVGLGVVLAHPESTVRSQVWPGGDGVVGTSYHLTGPAFLVGTGRHFAIAPRLDFIPELFLSASRAHVPIFGGEASLFDVAVHAVLGLGFRF